MAMHKLHVRPLLMSAALLLTLLAGVNPPARAQLLPVTVTVSGDTASVSIGSLLGISLANMTITFTEPENLTPGSLGIIARIIGLLERLPLLRRLTSLLVNLVGGLPLLVTIEPPVSQGLLFRRTARVELRSFLLPYTPGSRIRLFKGRLLGPFYDVTDEIAPGSVRARGTVDGFSQFMFALDLRPTNVVVAEKFARLRAAVDVLAPAEQPPFDAFLDEAELAVAEGRFPDAIVAIDAFSARASDRAGLFIPDEWQAGGTLDNQAGRLMAGAATLKFSVGFLRDYGL